MGKECDNCSRDLSEEQLKKVVDLVIQRMSERAYIQVGKQVVGGLSKFLFYVGAFATALYSILKAKGIIS